MPFSSKQILIRHFQKSIKWFYLKDLLNGKLSNNLQLLQDIPMDILCLVLDVQQQYSSIAAACCADMGTHKPYRTDRVLYLMVMYSVQYSKAKGISISCFLYKSLPLLLFCLLRSILGLLIRLCQIQLFINREFIESQQEQIKSLYTQK